MNQQQPCIAYMKTLGSVLTLLLLLTAGASAQQDDPCKSIRIALASVFDAPTFTLAEIERNRGCFNNGFVRVVGIYRVTFENSDLYDPTEPKARAWFSADRFHAAVKRCSGSSLKSLNRDAGGTWGLTALGVVNSSGRYGHMHGWDIGFDVICIEKAELLAGNGWVFESLPTTNQGRILSWYKKESRK